MYACQHNSQWISVGMENVAALAHIFIDIELALRCDCLDTQRQHTPNWTQLSRLSEPKIAKQQWNNEIMTSSRNGMVTLFCHV